MPTKGFRIQYAKICARKQMETCSGKDFHTRRNAKHHWLCLRWSAVEWIRDGGRGMYTV